MIRNGYTYTPDGDRNKRYKISRIETISSGSIDMNKVGSSDEINEQYRMEQGDILVSHINSIQYLGNSAIYNIPETLYHGMNLLCVRCNHEKIDPEYLHAYMLTDMYFKFVRERAKRAVNQCSIPVSDFKELPVCVPTIVEQERISSTFKWLDNLITLHQRGKT